MDSYYQRNKDKIKAKYQEMKKNKVPQKQGRKQGRKHELLNDEDKTIDIQIQEYNRLVTLFFKMKDQKLNTEEIELRIDILKYRLDNDIVLV